MPLQKKSIPINFSLGVDTKTDPWQLALGRFQALWNMIFTKGGLLTKRNGYQPLPKPPTSNTLTTFKGNLIAIGTMLAALLQGASTWFSQGQMQTVSLSTLALAQPPYAVAQVDTAIAPSVNLMATAWMNATTGSTFEVQIQDSITSQAVGPVFSSAASSYNPRVFVLGNYFLVLFTGLVSSSPHLQYVAFPINNPTNVIGPVDLSTQVSSDQAAFDGAVSTLNGTLYFAWDGSDGGGALRASFLSPTLGQGNTVVSSGLSSTLISTTIDDSGSNPVFCISSFETSTITFQTYNHALTAILAPTSIDTGDANIQQLTSAATGGLCTIFAQKKDTFSFASSVRSDFIFSYVVDETSGSAASRTVIASSMGLGSKAFIINSQIYFVGAFGAVSSAFMTSQQSGVLQPTYFLFDASGNILSRWAYQNGGGYYSSFALPSVTITGNVAQLAYLYKDLIQAANPASLTPPSTAANVYTQTGIKLISFNFAPVSRSNVEIADNLHIAGGLLWMYDGAKPVEHGFLLYPENIGTATATTGGFLTAQVYYYQIVFEWTDSQGNVHRSAPSLPIVIDLSASMTSTNANTLYVPNLYATYKSNIRVTAYRWSTAQPLYYQVTSISSPYFNPGGGGGSSDCITITDTLAGSSIQGNNLIYTTGNVLENIAAPATNALTLYRNRVWLINAENPNEFWFSQLIEQGEPVQFSDALTYYAGPAAGTVESTGAKTALFPMDDKLTFAAEEAWYYLTGDGPDATGANSDYQDPVFVTATVGCINQQSIVLTPIGLLFDTDKGRWLLSRELSTNYLGAPVETYNGYGVTSAQAIPGTNQIRMTLATTIQLMYDYYYDQWGFFNLPQAETGCLYQGLQTLLTSGGQVLQETPGKYLDVSSPVLLSFTTGWINPAGLQGFQRAYYFYLLGQFLSPHKLSVQIAYDYNPAFVQNPVITPINYTTTYGSDPLYGDAEVFGGEGSVEQWRIFLKQQKCQAFQITVQEFFDPSFSTQAGPGLSLSGLNLVVGLKKGYPVLRPSLSVG